jgi:hypothetical protein
MMFGDGGNKDHDDSIRMTNRAGWRQRSANNVEVARGGARVITRVRSLDYVKILLHTSEAGALTVLGRKSSTTSQTSSALSNGRGGLHTHHRPVDHRRPRVG